MYRKLILDPENDVVRVSDGRENIQIGDIHDEIDIVRVDIDAQQINLTFGSYIDKWNNSHKAIIALYKKMRQNPLIKITNSYPYYTITYDNFSSSLGFSVLLKRVSEGENNFPEFNYWTVINWSEDLDLAQAVGNASDKTITIDIPKAAYDIPDNIMCIVCTSYCETIGFYETYVESISYVDFVPEKYNHYISDQNICGYNLSITFCLILGLSLLLLKWKKKS